jgi:hypothetical protein
MPLFTKESADDVPDILNAPLPATAPAASGSSQSSSGGGFFSGIVDSLNPFSSKKP